MFLTSYLTVILLLVIGEWFTFTDAEYTRKCTKKAYEKYAKGKDHDSGHIFEHSRRLASEFQECFFKKNTDKANQKECVQDCKKNYQKCHNAVPRYSNALQFSCKLGLSKCVEHCHPSASKRPTQNCKTICQGDFLKCFYANTETVKAFTFTMICIETKTLCINQPSCYRNEKCETASDC